MQFLKLYILTLIPLLVLDFIWLGFMAKGFYAARLGYLYGDRFNYIVAFVFYLLYSAGVAYFVVSPNLNASTFKVFLIGAFLGLIAYATYDLTNHATIKNWPLAVTVVDLLWGAFVTGATATIALNLLKFF